MHRTRSPRAARAALIASALTVLTLVGHTAGHGALDALGIGLTVLLATGLATATSRRRLTPGTVLGVLLAGQLLLHVVLTFTSAHHSGAPSISTPLMVLGHVIAAVVATGVVMSADALVRAWMRFLAAIIGRAVPRTTLPAAPAHQPLSHLVAKLEATRLRHDVVRRGPPVPALALN